MTNYDELARILEEELEQARIARRKYMDKVYAARITEERLVEALAKDGRFHFLRVDVKGLRRMR